MNIAKNTFSYISALVFQKTLGFIYFTLLARGLGVVNTGRYTLALSITTIFSILADLGLVNVLIREIAKRKEKASQILSQVIPLKALLVIFTYSAVVFFVNFLNYPALVKQLVYLAGLVMVLDSFSLIFWGIFRGYQDLRFEAAGIIVFQVINTTLGLTALYFGLGVKIIMTALLIASLSFFIMALSLVKNKLGINFRWQLSKDKTLPLLKLALPFALAGIFARIYTQLDTVMLSKFSCDLESASFLCEQYVGWYSIASKVILALQFIPLAFSASLYPAFAEISTRFFQQLKGTYLKAQKYLALIGLPISLGVITTAESLIPFIWSSAFKPAALPLQILMVSLVFLFLTMINGALLNALNKQTQNTVFMGLAVVVNIALNFLLIPRLAMLGAALASLVAAVTLFFLSLNLAQEMIKFKNQELLRVIYKPVLASLVMGLILWLLRLHLSPLWLVVLGVVIYFSLIIFLKVITKDEWFEIISLFRRKNN